MSAASEILDAAAGSLCLDLRFLTRAVLSLHREVLPGTGVPVCDGHTITFHEDTVVDSYLKDHNSASRIIAHCAMHCILGHSDSDGNGLRDLAEDMMVEYILDSLDTPHISVPGKDERTYACERLIERAGGPGTDLLVTVLEGEQGWKLDRYLALFHCDDHTSRGWSDAEWSEMSKQAMTEVEGFASSLSDRSEALLKVLRIRNRRRYDYREFLRKFVSRRALPKEDPDSFDPIYYTYGLMTYGNIPLVDSSEISGGGSVKEFVIAIDTSGSTSGELVTRFLEEAMEAVRQCLPGQNANIHVIQCDDIVRSDDVITCDSDIQTLMSSFRINGGGRTDFRPVFQYVDRLISEGGFKDLRGLMYFTDGMGTYPEKRPGYDTAFVFCDRKLEDHLVPPWAMRIEVDPGDILRRDL